MIRKRAVSQEAQAIERVVRAARAVHAASMELQTKVGTEQSRQPSTLELVRFAAAMQELEAAREAFDKIVSEERRNGSRVDSSPLFTSESPKP